MALSLQQLPAGLVTSTVGLLAFLFAHPPSMPPPKQKAVWVMETKLASDNSISSGPIAFIIIFSVRHERKIQDEYYIVYVASLIKNYASVQSARCHFVHFLLFELISKRSFTKKTFVPIPFIINVSSKKCSAL